MLVVISVEFSVRELDAQIFLAHELASKGFQCIVLYDQIARVLTKELAAKNINHILIDKSASESCLPKRIMQTKRLQKSLAYILFQEGFVNIKSNEDSRNSWKKYTSKEAEQYVDGFFTFGEISAHFLQKDFPCLASKVFNTGNPRIDLLQQKYSFFYQKEVEALRCIYGDFILFNDSHLYPDCSSSPDGVDLRFPQLWMQDENFAKKAKIYQHSFHEYNKKFHERVTLLLLELAKKFDNHNIIVRPHPNNRLDVWPPRFHGANNIYVENCLPVEPWLLASNVLLADRCTTGMQMIAAKKIAVSLDILKRPHNIISNFSELAEYNAHDLDQLHKCLDKIMLNTTLPSSTVAEAVSSYLSCDGNARERIVSQIIRDCDHINLPLKNPALDVFKFNFSNVKVAAHKPWKWQPGLMNRIRNNIESMNRFFNVNVASKCIGWNCYAIRQI